MIPPTNEILEYKILKLSKINYTSVKPKLKIVVSLKQATEDPYVRVTCVSS